MPRHLRHLSSIHRQEFTERRKIEWKVIFGVLSFYVLVVGARYAGHFIVPDTWGTAFLIWGIAIVLALATCNYLRLIHGANRVNKKFAEAAENAMIDEDGIVALREVRERASDRSATGGNWSLGWQCAFVLVFAVVAALLLTAAAPEAQLSSGPTASAQTTDRYPIDEHVPDGTVRVLPAPDLVTLVALHALVYAFLVFAIAKDIKWQRPGAIKRSNESWGKFYLVHGLVLLFLFQVVGTTRPPAWNYLPLLSVADFLAIGYLALFNGWFRNRLVGLFSKMESRPE